MGDVEKEAITFLLQSVAKLSESILQHNRCDPNELHEIWQDAEILLVELKRNGGIQDD